MTASGPDDSFTAGRAYLRDTAKWLLSGSVGVATLIIGSSTFSQLGSFSPHDPRFIVAVVALLIAALLCLVPFLCGVAVLRSEVVNPDQMILATRGDWKTAAKNLSEQLGKTLPGETGLTDFVRDYRDIRTKAFQAAGRGAAGARAVAPIDAAIQTCRQAYVSELVAIRFDRLVLSILFPGSLIFLAFLVFVWAANPPKVSLLDKPYAERLTPDRIGELAAAGVVPPCLTPGARLIVVSAPDGGSKTAVLIGPDTATCPPRSVTISRGRVAQVQ